MSDKPKWRSVIDVILPHATHPQILVQQAAGCWRLPQLPVTETEPLWLRRIITEIRGAFGIETTLLQMIAGHVDESERLDYSTFLLEIDSSHWAPPVDTRWIGEDELDEVVFGFPSQRAAMEAYFDELSQGTIPALRVAWSRPGWQRQAERWIRAQLAQLGYELTGPIEQVRNWILSCVLRAPTDKGAVFFKATNGSPLMVREAQFTQALATLFPEPIPMPLCIEPAHDWMLLTDFGEEVGWEAPIETREEVLCTFGRLQIATAPRVDELLALGCGDRRLPRLAAQIEPLLSDPEMMAYIEKERQEQLWAAAPRLRAICAELDQYHAPATLVHGDMHMSNVAHRGAGYLFFDWTDACIAHPFLDMIAIVHEKDAAVQARLRDGYLKEWLAYEPMERLLEMWRLADPLCALHQAVSYRYILANTEERCKYELDWAIPFWFSKILESLDMQHS
jgi:hypothetical protein